MPGEYLVFHNGGVLTDSGVTPDGMVVVRDGLIDYVGPFEADRLPEGAETVDAGGQFIAPGFVDIHVHGGDGADFMDATAEDVERVLRFHARHGTTSVCATTATAPLDEILAAIDAIESRRADPEWARILGVHVEGPYLTMSKRGCHLPEHVRTPQRHEWEQILERGKIASMTLAPELPGGRELVEALYHGGAIASAGHSEALYHEMDEAIAWGVRHVTHLYCAMTDAMNNRWRGTPNPRAAGMVEAVYLNDELSSELITDGKHLSAEMLRMAMRNKGYEKLAIITDAMRGAGMPDGEYAFGPRNGMTAIVRNREARIPDGTALASSVYAMNEMVRTFRELTGCPLWQAVRMASLTPAEIAGESRAIGSLARGKKADILVLDDQVEIREVYREGHRLRAVPGAAGD
ncbi:MAG: N-acetylglucosamine-6-phosphate deacetylase [Bryobacteraceae bacterium]